jgi:hypothetical protein
MMRGKQVYIAGNRDIEREKIIRNSPMTVGRQEDMSMTRTISI